MGEPVRVIEFGTGACVVNWGRYGGKPAVFIEPLPDGKPGTEGALVPAELQGSDDSVPEGTIILTFAAYPTTFLEYISRALEQKRPVQADVKAGT